MKEEGVRASRTPLALLLLSQGLLALKVRPLLQLRKIARANQIAEPSVDRYLRYRVVSSGKAEPVSGRGVSLWRALSPAPGVALLPRLVLSLVYRSSAVCSIQAAGYPHCPRGNLQIP